MASHPVFPRWGPDGHQLKNDVMSLNFCNPSTHSKPYDCDGVQAGRLSDSEFEVESQHPLLVGGPNADVHSHDLRMILTLYNVQVASPIRHNTLIVFPAEFCPATMLRGPPYCAMVHCFHS